MRKLMLLSALAAGCVFQENPELSDQEANNVSNNLTNNLTNAPTNNSGNNTTNNTVNNSNNTSPTNNTTNNEPLECSPQPEFCEGYFQCGDAIAEPANDQACHYSCGTCPTDSQCLASSQLCSRGEVSTPSEAILDSDDFRSGVVVIWENRQFGTIDPEGASKKIDFGLDFDNPPSAISASATKWLAVGQASQSSVVIGALDDQTKYVSVSAPAVGFGNDVALADVETLPNSSAEFGVGVVGAYDGNNAFIISKTAQTDWAVGASLNPIVGINELFSGFGERVAISPNGRVVLVSSSDGVEVFRPRSGQTVWDHAETLRGNQEFFGQHFVVDDSYAVVASTGELNVYDLSEPDIGRNGERVVVTSSGTIIGVDIVSSPNKTVVFVLVRNAGVTSLQMFQPADGGWIRTNTVVSTDLTFEQFERIEAGIYLDPAEPLLGYPFVAVSGNVDENVREVRMVPLITKNEPVQ